MNIEVKPAKYILAVSGGVDSMVLLDVLSKKKNLEFVVAHFDHGIREDSYQDAELVERVSKIHGLVFELGHGKLGPKASEEIARDARYKFLNKVLQKHKAEAIITAHQQDDVIETAIINILRGTGTRGIVSLVNSKTIVRPLLNIPKQDIRKYALDNKLSWREDSTNEDTNYLRNYVRKNVASKLSDSQKTKLLKNIEKLVVLQNRKDELAAEVSSKVKKDDSIDRQLFALLPNDVGSELVVNWMRDYGHKNFDKKSIQRANNLLRTAMPGTKHDISKNLEIVVDKFFARFK